MWSLKSLIKQNQTQVHKLDSFWNTLFSYFYIVYLSSEYYSVLCTLCTVRAVKERRNLVNSENLKMKGNKATELPAASEEAEVTQFIERTFSYISLACFILVKCGEHESIPN